MRGSAVGAAPQGQAGLEGAQRGQRLPVLRLSRHRRHGHTRKHQGAGRRSPGARSDDNLIDNEELPNGVKFTYFVAAEFDDGPPRTLSGPSNFATITAVNDPPAANADAFSTTEDTPLTIATCWRTTPTPTPTPARPGRSWSADRRTVR